MYDYLDVLKGYTDVKDVLDLVDDVQKLRFYYTNQQYDAMIQHIQQIVVKYPVDANIWNFFNPVMPDTYDKAFFAAENFLRTKGFGLLLEKGYDLSQYLKQEDLSNNSKMWNW